MPTRRTVTKKCKYWKLDENKKSQHKGEWSPDPFDQFWAELLTNSKEK